MDALQRIKRALPPRDWSALYQQEPTPEEGDYFKAEWIHPVQSLPPLAEMRVYGGSDYAVTSDGGDYTVHAVIGLDPDENMYLLDIWRKQAASDEWVEAWCDLVLKWNPMGWAEELGQIKSGVGPFLEKRAHGVIVNRQGIRGVADDIKGTLAQEAYHPKNQPKLSNFLGELESLSVGRGVPGQVTSGGVTLSGLDTTRKMLRAARASTDSEERRLAKIAAERFDDYLSNLKPSEIAAGRSKEGVAALNEARSLWTSYRKADLVEEALTAAQQRASTTGSGGNVDNAIRQEFRKILTNRKKSAGFTDAEKAALARVASGTKGQNTLRLLGKLAPQGDGLRMMLSLGAAGASGGASLPFSALGAGAKALADNATKKNVERLSQLIRARGLNIDPEEVVKAAQADRLRNFFTSIGINVGKLADDLGRDIADTARGIAPGQLPSRADDEGGGIVPPERN